MVLIIIGLVIGIIWWLITDRHYTALAIIVVPPISGILSGLVVGSISYLLPLEIQYVTPMVLSVYGAIVGTLLGIPAAATSGLLTHVIFIRKGLTHLWAYLAAGTAGGILAGAGMTAMAMILAPAGTSVRLDERFLVPVTICLMVTFSAVLFWAVRRPHKIASAVQRSEKGA